MVDQVELLQFLEPHYLTQGVVVVDVFRALLVLVVLALVEMVRDQVTAVGKEKMHHLQTEVVGVVVLVIITQMIRLLEAVMDQMELLL
jgi:hypothetical protein